MDVKPKGHADAEDFEDFGGLDETLFDDKPEQRPPQQRPATEKRYGIPDGASMGKYTPRLEPPYCHGMLPVGRVDASGERHRVRNWNAAGTSEADIICEIDQWLWDNS